jgi:hypothetical protein
VPLALLLTCATACARSLVRKIETSVWSGLSAHAGSGGLRSTGQVGPAITVPRMPELFAATPPVLPDDVEVAVVEVDVGHAAKSQLGPVRPTQLPSGHCIASAVQATGADVWPRVTKK